MSYAVPRRPIRRSWSRHIPENARAEIGSIGFGKKLPGISCSNDVTLASALEKEAMHGHAQHRVRPDRSVRIETLVPGEKRIECIPTVDGNRHIEQFQVIRGATTREG